MQLKNTTLNKSIKAKHSVGYKSIYILVLNTNELLNTYDYMQGVELNNKNIKLLFKTLGLSGGYKILTDWVF